MMQDAACPRCKVRTPEIIRDTFQGQCWSCIAHDRGFDDPVYKNRLLLIWTPERSREWRLAWATTPPLSDPDRERTWELIRDVLESNLLDWEYRLLSAEEAQAAKRFVAEKLEAVAAEGELEALGHAIEDRWPAIHPLALVGLILRAGDSQLRNRDHRLRELLYPDTAAWGREWFRHAVRIDFSEEEVFRTAVSATIQRFCDLHASEMLHTVVFMEGFETKSTATADFAEPFIFEFFGAARSGLGNYLSNELKSALEGAWAPEGARRSGERPVPDDAQTTRFCTNCGSAVSVLQKFCTSCGRPLA